MATGIDWPAWVQAVGSVVALFLTGGLAVFEVRQRRREVRVRIAEELRSKIAVLEFAAVQITDFMQRQLGDERNVKVAMTGGYEALKDALSTAEHVVVTGMPSAMSVRWFFVFQAASKIYKKMIQEYYPNFLDAAVLQRLKSAYFFSQKSIEELKKEADRVERGEKSVDVGITDEEFAEITKSI